MNSLSDHEADRVEGAGVVEADAARAGVARQLAGEELGDGAPARLVREVGPHVLAAPAQPYSPWGLAEERVWLNRIRTGGRSLRLPQACVEQTLGWLRNEGTSWKSPAGPERARPAWTGV